ncbi:MAG TPA: CpsB/CapC family capsule biosynthesis tyrosine phosphatase [Hymenobacter sp.]|uniref:tyrosine-protein phosphatase n=1 Tax=Hymenobacter sp. TaxID=1898978 RepID=UPI002D8073A6|nr:CpsB/CapC family capsule biosynthesis tyrosine phosphatase [Hymenobacter sp.]HET9502369.1 CpsB/CapC family capsule biosynthesis tyrosine phosphatase [Hymenobacter sp.]
MAGFWQRLWGSGGATGGRAAQQGPPFGGLHTDMHSHLLPGLDDGAETVAHSLELLRELRELGFRKLVMTPHVMGDFYKNTPEGIRAALDELRTAAAAAGLDDVQLECAAEYYLDEWLGQKLEAGTELLTFGGERRYLLFETSYMNEPFNLQATIFGLKAAGYQPVLAHPERYTYFYGRLAEVRKLREEYGVLLQLNLNSLAGYYSPAARRVAEQLIDERLIDFVGTDTHHLRHTAALAGKTVSSSYFQKLMALPLLNSTL